MPSVNEITESVKFHFWKKVGKTDGCWEWLGTRAPGKWPYGSMRVGARPKVLAHRVSWVIHFGEIPAGMLVCHTCDRPECVRPDHLFLGTDEDNMVDAVLKGRMGKKLTIDEVQEIRRLRAEGMKLRELGERFGVAWQSIQKIMRGKRWKHLESETGAEIVDSRRIILNDDQVLEIRRLHAAGEGGYIVLGKRFGVCSANIRDIVKRKSWKHLGADKGSREITPRS